MPKRIKAASQPPPTLMRSLMGGRGDTRRAPCSAKLCCTCSDTHIHLIRKALRGGNSARISQIMQATFFADRGNY